MVHGQSTYPQAAVAVERGVSACARYFPGLSLVTCEQYDALIPIHLRK